MIGFTQSLLPIEDGEGDHEVVEGFLSARAMTPPSARFTRIHLPINGEEK
jgi:hypothetical protein